MDERSSEVDERSSEVDERSSEVDESQYRPNPQPLPYKGRGVRFKASLQKGERLKSIAYKREPLFFRQNLRSIASYLISSELPSFVNR